MGYDELSKHLRPIVEREPSVAKNQHLLTNIGFEWERKKHLGQVKDIDRENPFRYIKGEFSVYAAHGVYSYIWQALTKKLKVIRLGPGSLKGDEQPDSFDKFNKYGEAMIPYFLEAVHQDKILREHLEINQIGSMLVIKINV